MSPREAVTRLLAERIGLDPTSVGDGLIDRGMRVRMAALGCADVAAYEWILNHSGTEVQELIEEVVIPESWFFRDARPFETLAEEARSGWVIDRSRPPLNVLSIPCAGGEEPYSIAMTLVDVGLPPARFRVEAVDVSERSLARGVAAAYGANSFRGVDPAARARHFREERGRYVVDPAIRASVRFRLGNILDPALLRDRGPFDMIFCRNMLIYFDRPARALAFATLDRLARDGALLFLGHADRVDEVEGSAFAPLADKGSFSYRKGAPARLGLPAPKARPRATPSPTPGPVAAAGTGPATAPPARTSRPVEPEELAGVVLERASKLADAGRHEEAAALIDRALTRGASSAPLHFLLGLIRVATGHRDAAEAQFHKAIYLDAQHDEALLALAALSHRKGDVAAEAAYRRRAGRVLARKGMTP